MDKTLEYKHLCKDCLYQFPTCTAINIVWGIDKNPNAKGADADKVLECDTYVRTIRQNW